MRELTIKCLECGCEDFTISSHEGITITCDGCGLFSKSPEKSEERDVRQEDIYEEIHALTPQGRIYFISSAGKDAPVKIGYTKSQIEDRIRVLQTGHPYKLELLANIEGGYPLETAFHKIFANHRLNGEWFKRSPELIALVEALNPENHGKR